MALLFNLCPWFMPASPDFSTALPIDDVIPDIQAALNQAHELVLEAPPGAGKTTRVPLALLNEPWLRNKKIIMLEPRRLAAKSSAERMAEQLGESAGQTVGFRIRMENKVSSNTRIEVVTEGILTRQLQQDPSLADVGLVIFDEFHERNLHADLALALLLQGRSLFRDDDPLRIIVMSATLDGAQVAKLLEVGSQPTNVISSLGRTYPVTIHYGDAFTFGERIEPRVIYTVKQAVSEQEGSVLVFLPGQREIRRVAADLQAVYKNQPEIHITPLYGDLDFAAQRRAIEPAPKGVRKIVLATSIAETSITIDGVTVVIDAGLQREAVFDPRTAMTRLQTKRCSRAAADQRAGRAGRTAPGVCYRLWSESQQQQLAAFAQPEILNADLSALALQLLQWGVDSPTDLQWLDPPPNAAYTQACELLQALEAVEQLEPQPDKSGWQITPHGEAISSLGANPRLAHMMIRGAQLGVAEVACNIAALLTERDPLRSDQVDISLRLRQISNGDKAFKRVKQQARQFQSQIKRYMRSQQNNNDGNAIEYWPGILLALAYPDRIAQQRQSNSPHYVLSNGRAVVLPEQDNLVANRYLAIADLGGVAGKQNADRVFLAARLEPSSLENELAFLLKEKTVAEWDEKNGRFNAEKQRCIGALVLDRQRVNEVDSQAKNAAVIAMIRKRGLGVLGFNQNLENWLARLSLMRSIEPDNWPDLSKTALLDSLEQWLTPYLSNVKNLNQLQAIDFNAALLAMLSWEQQQRLQKQLPEKIAIPSGEMVRIDYSQSPPVLAARIQQMFGLAESPVIADGRLSLQCHLLSPAKRPLAVTQDLSSFWENAYQDIKKELKGRYPKHPWPDDPINAEATNRAKPRKIK